MQHSTNSSTKIWSNPYHKLKCLFVYICSRLFVIINKLEIINYSTQILLESVLNSSTYIKPLNKYDKLLECPSFLCVQYLQYLRLRDLKF